MTQNVRIERPWGNGRIANVRDGTANDSDKTFTVPANTVWLLLGVRATIVCTATVGNRILSVQIGDGTALIWGSPNTANITASNSGNIYCDTNNSENTTPKRRLDTAASSLATIQLSTQLPELYLEAGYTIRVFDTAAVDAAADDLTVILEYIEYQV